MAFSIGVCEHPQFELLHLLSELYKGYSLTLSINFLILNIWLFIEASILKTYFSQYHTPPRSSRGKTMRLFSHKHRASISTLLCIILTYEYIDHSNLIDLL
jgi:hypothetical protein